MTLPFANTSGIADGLFKGVRASYTCSHFIFATISVVMNRAALGKVSFLVIVMPINGI